jgi:hypothetical protein
MSIASAPQWLVDARFRAARLIESIETVRETPAQLVAVAHRVRRRVQALSAFTIVCWLAVLVALLEWPASIRLSHSAYSLRWIVCGIGVVSLVLLVLSILQVRRLPAEPAMEGANRYPRRMR